MRKKNAVAQALVALRWKKSTPAQRTAAMRHAANVRWARYREEKERAEAEERAS